MAVINDATSSHAAALDADRLCRWQSALFPGGTSGIHRIAVGRFRDHADPMQIAGGRLGREVVYYVAPPSADVPVQMAKFLDWFNETAPGKASSVRLDGLARAAIAHLWFESIHPFEDGNGRIGRAIVDMAVAQHLRLPFRLFSLSRQLLDSRSDYYDHLNESQRGGMDVTSWVQWFARKCSAAYAKAGDTIDQALVKRRFIEHTQGAGLDERQRKVVHRLLDVGDGGFRGGLNAGKYIKMTGISKATATRDLAEMVEHGVLRTSGAGKALRYFINVPGWTHGTEQVDVAARQETRPSLDGGLLSTAPAPNEPSAEVAPLRRSTPNSRVGR